MKVLIFAAALIAGAAGALGLSARQITPDDYQYSPEYKIRMAEHIIESFYVDSADVDKAVEAGIIAMLGTLDPHSTYTNAEETRELNEPLQGGFSGIGISFNMLNDTLYVVSTVAGGPSEKVGISAGDRIIFANDTLMSGAKRNNTFVRSILRGPKGTPVNLKVKRGAATELIDFRVVRDEIPIYSVDASYMAAPGVGYIRISRFAEDTPKEVATALKNLRKEGMKQLIIDLEGNGGGYMNAATLLSDMFLNRGETIVFTKGARQPANYFRADGSGEYKDIDIVILVDQTSASASEILSGAIQDNDRGVIVGRRTFGKGLVQRPFPFPDGSMIRLTTSRYYTPSGRSIQKPYDHGDAEYRNELTQRLKSGELTSDSATSEHPDSLRYFTRGGRPVYGGGGISPDIHVALDTTFFTNYYRDVVARGILNRYVLSYVDDNRATLKKNYPNEDSFISKFTVTPAMIEGLNRLAESDSIKIDPEQLELSRERLSLFIKALIGRDLFEPATYYKVANTSNPSFRTALDILADTKRYGEILRGTDFK